MKLFSRGPARHRLAGYSLIELNIATGMVGAFVAMVMMMNSSLLGLIKTAKESCSATQALQERVEQMRIANWVQITDSNYIAANLLNTATNSSVGLPGVVESMTVSSVANPSWTPVKVTRDSGVQINSLNATLQSERMVRVDLKLVWRGMDRRQHTRSTCALIAKGGISK
jgi:hypothetical protein